MGKQLLTILCSAALLMLAATAQPAAAYDFNWGPSFSITTNSGSYSIPGSGFTSPVEDQGEYGVCWDFAAIGALESRYKLTRNDASYSAVLSESQYLAADNWWGGGDPNWTMDYSLTNPIVQLSELPFNSYGPNPTPGTWPLQPGWQNRGVLGRGVVGGSTAVATVKAALLTDGPVVMSVCAETDFYWPGGSVPTSQGGIDHDIDVVGWHDATSADAPQIQSDGGYWIIKNQWSTGWGSYGGYSFIPYGFGGSITAYTGPAYFTGALATATWQGSGSVWASGSNNWTSGGSAYPWVNQETAAIFNASSNNHINISGPAIAHSLTFNPGATGYIFSGGSLTVTAGGITAGESVTINSPVTIGAPQTWTTAAGKTLTVNGNVSTIVSLLTVGGAGATTINGVVGNGGALTGIGGGLTMQGPGTLTLTSSNTFSGATTVSGGMLDLTGTGAIASSSGLSLVGGTFLLDNSSINNPARIPGGIGVNLGGGEMSLTGNAAGTIQTIGSLSLQQGASTITVTPNGQLAGWSTGTFSRGTGAAALVRGPALGSGSAGAAQVKFSNIPTLSGVGMGTAVGILPYLFGDNSPAGNGTDLVTYNSSYGVTLLSGSQYSGSVAAGTNVKLASSPAAISANTSILALVLSNSGAATQLAINSGNSLTLTSGALLSTGSAANTISGGTLTFGTNSATAYEGIVHTASNLTIGSAVTNNGSNAVILTKSGPAMLSFSGANTYSGGTTVGGGTLQIASGGSLISGGSVAISGGNAPAFTVSGGTVSTSNSGNAFYLGGTAGQTGVVNVSAGSVAVTNASSSIMLGDNGTGIWNQSGGTTTAANQFWGANQAGSIGQLNVSGGYLSAGNCILVSQRGAGTLNVSGGLVTTPWLAMLGWTNSPATATVNLNGGTLAVSGVHENYSGQSAAGQATFIFNGGLLRSTSASATFLQGLDYTYVQNGGAMIDTQGYNDTIGQALLSYAGTSSGGMTKYGSGTLTLTASNTYTGLTTVNGGLQLGDGVANTGSVAGNIALLNSATLTFANPATQTYASSISGTGSLVKSGPGLLVLSGTNTYLGTTTIAAGELEFSTSSSAPAAPFLPDITIASGAVLAASGPYTTVTAWLGSGRIAPSSSGTISLTGSSNLAINLSTSGYSGLSVGSIGANTYTGAFTPAGSTYYLGGAGGTLVMPNNGALVDGGGPRNLVVNGGLALAGSNNFSGGTTLNPAGLLYVNNAAAIGSGPLTIAGGTLGNSSAAAVTLANNPQSWNGDFIFAGPNSLNLGSGAVAMGSSRTLTVSAGSLTVGGTISGAGDSLTLAGAGTLVLGGSNTFSGPLNLNGGVLNFANGYNLGSSMVVNFNGGTLQYAPGTTYNLAGQSLNIGGFGGSIDLGTNSAGTLSAALSGGGQLNKTGTSTLTYGGTSTSMSGTINLAGGTFTVAPGAGITGLGTATQSNQTSVTWNVNGTLGATNVNLAPGANSSYQSSTGVLNIKSGGSMTATTMTLASDNTFVGGAYATVNVNSGGTLTAANMNMSYVNYGYQTAVATINVNGVLNVTSLQGLSPGGAYGCSVQRYINVNAGGELNAATINLSQAGGGSYTRQLNLSGGTLANLSGANLTVDSTTLVKLVGNNTLLTVSPTNSLTISGPISGTGSLTTAGIGAYVLMGSNTYTGATAVAAGTLQIGANSAGSFLASPSVALGLGNPNGGTATALIFSPADAPTYSGAISGAGSVVMAGAGRETLAGSNTYTGGTIVSAGTLALRAAGTLGSGNITVSPGGVLDVSAYGNSGYNFSGGQFTAGRSAPFATDVYGSLNLNHDVINLAGGNLGSMTVSGSMALSSGTMAYLAGDQIALGGALSLGGTDQIVPQAWMGNGTYTLFTYNGGTPNLAALALTGSYANNPRQTYAFAISGGTAVTLVVTGQPANLIWTGSSGVWDTATSSNWYNLSSSAASVFYSADNVTFNDTAGTANNVSISGAVLPGSLTVSNTNVNFTFGGGAIVGNTSLVKNGPGALALNASNAYTGGTMLGGGLLNLGNAAALGTGTLTIGGGTLDNTSGTAMTLAANIPQNWNGSFAFLGSAPLNLGNGAVALGASPTVTVSAGTLTVGGGISGAGSLTKTGSGTLVLAAGSSYTGGTTLTSGGLMLNANQALGTGPLTIAGGTLGNTGGAAITLANIPQNWNGDFTFAGPNSVNLGSGAVAMSSNRTVTVSGGSLTVGGPISGAGDSLTLAGTGTLVLGGSNTFSGPLNLNGGVLNFANGYNLGGGTAVNFNGGTLQYATGNTSSLAGQTITLGALGGSIDLGANSAGTLAATAIGTGPLNKLGSSTLTYAGSSSAMTGTIKLAGGTFTVAPGAGITGLGTATQSNQTSVTWNVNGTLGATNVNLAPGANSGYNSSTGVLNINSGGHMTATTMTMASANQFVGGAYATVNVNSGGTLTAATMNMSYVNYGYQTAVATINVNGVLNVTNLQGMNPGGAYDCSVQRYINVNAGGELNAATINLSQAGGGSYTRQLNLSGGTLANLSGANLTVDSTTLVKLVGNNTLLAVSPTNSLTISGPISGTGSLTTAGNGVYVLSGSNTYTGGTSVPGGTLSATQAAALAGYATPGAISLSNSAMLAVNAGGTGEFSPANIAGLLAANGSSFIPGTTLGIDTTNAASPVTLASGISGAMGLSKLGGGTLALVAANSYSGATTVTNGYLVLAASSGYAIPGSLTFGNGSNTVNPYLRTTQNFQFAPGAVMTFVNAPGGYTRFELQGTQQALAGISDSLGGGVVQNSESGIAGNSQLTLSPAATASYAYAGYFRNGSSGTLGLAFNGPGTQTLSGANIIYTGSTSVTGGTLAFQNVSAFNSSINNNATVVWNATNASSNQASGLTLSGSGIYVKTGASDMKLGASGAGVTFALAQGGLFDVQQGILRNEFGSFNNWSSNLGSLQIDSGGTFDVWDANTQIDVLHGTGTLDKGIGGTQTITVGAANGSGTFGGLIQNTLNDGQTSGTPVLNLTKTGSGTQTLTGANTYTGVTTISGGTLEIGAGGTTGSLSPSSAITDNATLVFNLSSNAAQGAAFSSSGISGSGGLVQIGPGSLTLTASNTYTGATTISGGTLAVNGSLAAGSTVAVGAAATLAGSGKINGNTSLTGNGVINLSGGTLGGGLAVSGGNWTGTGTVAGAITSSSNTFTIGNAANLAAIGGMNVTGGILTGLGTVSGGTVTLGPGAAISPGTISGGTLTFANLASSGGAFNFNLSGTAASNSDDAIAVTGNLSLGGTTTLDILPVGTLATSGAYTLFTYGGKLTESGSTALTIPSGILGVRQTAAFNYGSGANSAITLAITGYNANLTWTGTQSNTWVNNTAGTASAYAWTSPTSHNSGGADFFTAGDYVTFNNAAGNTAVSLSGVVAPTSISVTGSNNFSFSGSGSIGGSTGLTVQGTSSLTIANSGVNTYSGGTTVQGGTLVLGGNNVLPTAGTVILGGSGSNGIWNLAGHNQTIGGLATASGAAASGQIITASIGNSTLTYNNAGGSSTYAGAIQDTALSSGGTLGLTVNGGTLDVSQGSTTYYGATLVNGGVLVAGALPNTSGALVAPGGTLIFPGVGIAAPALSNSGNVSFTAASGTATVASLTGPGMTTFAAGAAIGTLSNGTLATFSPASINTASGGSAVVTGPATIGMLDGATLTLGNQATIGTAASGVANLNGATATIGLLSGATVNLSSSTALSLTTETGGLIEGPGGVTMTNSSGTMTLGVANSYTGGTTLSAGLLSFANGALSSGNVTLSGGTLQWNGTNTQDISSQMVMVNGATATLDTQGNSVTLASGIGSGSTASLVKVGAGALTLAGANTYIGNTTISAGTLAVNGTLAAGAVAVGDGATLGGSGTVAGNATLAGNGTINLSGGTIGGTLGVNGGYWTGTGMVAGLTTLSSGAFTVGSAANMIANGGLAVTGGTLAGAGTVSGNATLTGDAVINLAGAGNIAGTLGASGGNWTGAGSVSGLVTVSNNTFTLGGGAILAANGGLAVTGGTLAGAGTVAGNVTLSNNAVINFAGGGNITGNLGTTGGNWNGAGAVGGLVTSAQNSLTLGSGGTLTAVGGLLVTGGQLAAADSTATLNGSLTYQSPAASTFAGAITRAQSTVAVNNPLASLWLTGASTYTVPTTVTAGLLSAVAGGISPASAITVNGGTLDLSSNPMTIASLNLGSSATLDLGVGNPLAASQSVSLAGTLNFASNAFNPSGGNYVVISTSGGLSGTFANIVNLDPNFMAVYSPTALNAQHRAVISCLGCVLISGSSIISGAAEPFTFILGNASPSGGAALNYATTAGSNVAGLAAGSLSAGSISGPIPGLIFTGTSVGPNQTGNFSVGDPNSTGTQNASVTVNVYDHALPLYAPAVMNLGYVHAGYAAPVTSNSFSVTNGNPGDYRVNLTAGGPTGTSGITLTSLSGILPGGSAAVAATLPVGVPAGTSLNQSIPYTFGDNSTLAGNNPSLSTASINVTGYVYSGVAVWAASGGGSWGTLANGFGANWNAGASPGLDPAFQASDTATFGSAVASGSATINLNGASPSLAALTFDNANACYTLAQGTGGTLSLASAVGAMPIYVAGRHAISAPLTLNTMAVIANAGPADSLSISGPISGSGGLQQSGPGALLLRAAASGNSFSGPTIVAGGLLSAGGAGGLSPLSAITVNGGTLDATAGPQTVLSLAVGAQGVLNLNVGNLLASSGAASFAAGSTLNLSGSIAWLPDLLMTYTGSPSGTFSNVTLDGASLPAADTLSYSSGSLEVVSTVPPSWTAASGQWSVATNWNSHTAPNGPDQVAVLGQSASGAVAVALDVPVTLGTLQFGNSAGVAARYALSGNTLTFSNSGDAALVVLGGTQSIASPLSIAGGNLDISASHHGILSITGPIADDGGDRSLTLGGDGSGTLILAGADSYQAGTMVDAGTLVIDSAAALPDDTGLTVGRGASTLFAPALSGPSAAAAEVAAVPEPSSLALLVASLAGVAVYCRLSSRRNLEERKQQITNPKQIQN
jgi:fibronectin-binding autotransporter adhesin